MFGMISMQNSYYNPYQMYRAAQAQAPQQAAVYAARRAAQPETPVQPVRPSSPVSGEDTAPVRLGPVIREGADPAEMAVRMRIRYDGEDEPSVPVDEDASQGVEGAQKALEEGKCETCEKRKYQDGSDDMGVSFQTPTRVDPDQAASAVRGHEMEHVVREQAKAQREDRKVVSQSVTLHTAICPECGKTYISGGTTRTTTAANTKAEAPANEPEEARLPFDVKA
ncbi:MAG: hypothetical protein HFF76_08840 [Oscillospiraceae bacterium]|jgi:hypothetical protein|nr:hypothetical protein [Oscillospiraceae bacterium]